MTEERIEKVVEAVRAALRGCCPEPGGEAGKEAATAEGRTSAEMCCDTRTTEPHVTIKVIAGKGDDAGCACVVIDRKGGKE
jgi:hypothetical protein